MTNETECSKCKEITECKETPSGFEVCKECWEKYNVLWSVREK
jgi:hypothetical protein